MNNVWDWLIPTLTLIVGLIAGFVIGVYYLKRQMEKMQSDPDMLQKMAKQMGYNMNRQQLAKAQQMMKQQGKNPGMKPPGKNGKFR
ncbi:YneF family protein [Gorillibacterium timonense]|uniref:YneF family protein n=1 Tax=Gorillibacterium timonense TaxID=1689269 RepID=UPI00071CDB8A|nr:YneF family protein [Gorillibacterium timonense]